jgi:hypothetical protein
MSDKELKLVVGLGVAVVFVLTMGITILGYLITTFC